MFNCENKLLKQKFFMFLRKNFLTLSLYPDLDLQLDPNLDTHL
jgi:hypothetical protein